VCVGGREGFEDVQPRVNEQKERSYRWIYYFFLGNKQHRKRQDTFNKHHLLA